MNTDELRELGLELWTQRPMLPEGVIARALTDTIGIIVTPTDILKWAAELASAS